MDILTFPELLSTIDVVVWWNPFTWIIWMYVRWSYVYYQPRAILLCFCWCGLTFSTLLMHMHVGHPMTLQTIMQLFVWAIIGSPELVFVFWRNSWIQKCARLVVQNGLWYVHVVSSNHSNWSWDNVKMLVNTVSIPKSKLLMKNLFQNRIVYWTRWSK